MGRPQATAPAPFSHRRGQGWAGGRGPEVPFEATAHLRARGLPGPTRGRSWVGTGAGTHGKNPRPRRGAGVGSPVVGGASCLGSRPSGAAHVSAVHLRRGPRALPPFPTETRRGERDEQPRRCVPGPAPPRREIRARSLISVLGGSGGWAAVLERAAGEAARPCGHGWRNTRGRKTRETPLGNRASAEGFRRCQNSLK